ncbi:MAG: AAA family ATPase [Pseudomonadota bacterium]
MYLDHFGLREIPFRITPHTDFFFTGAKRGATLEALIYAITHDEGIVKVGGEVGSGKTMLCRMLLENLPSQVETVYLANPSLSRDEILYAIANELKMPFAEQHTHLLLRMLQARLLELYAAGRQVVILIDEAHAMPSETLEEVRLLSNLESNRHKLLQIVLFGQPELDTRLNEVGMRQLKERITHNFDLLALRRDDVGSYLMFRMRAAGYHGPDLFSATAIQMIWQASEGLTRRINILATKALLAAFAENKHQIGRLQVKAAIRDARITPIPQAFARRVPWLVVLLVTVSSLLVVGYLVLAGRATLPFLQETASPNALLARALMPPMPSATASKPVVEAFSSADLGERMASTAEWLMSAPDTHYFVHLLSVDAADPQALQEAKHWLQSNRSFLKLEQVRTYRFELAGRNLLGFIYGDYPDYVLAEAALSSWPETVRYQQNPPYIRQLVQLRSELPRRSAPD